MLINVKKLEVVVNKKSLPSALELLQDAGFSEVVYERGEEKKSERTEEISKTEKKLAELRFAENFLKKFKPKEGNFFTNLIHSFFPIKPEADLKKIKKLLDGGEVDSIVYHCKEKELALNKLRAKKEKISEEVEVLRNFSGSSLALSEGDDGYISIVAGYVPVKSAEEFQLQISEMSRNIIVEKGGEDGRSIYFMLAYLKKDEEGVSKVLKDQGFKKAEIFWRKPASKELKDRLSVLSEIEKEEKKIVFEIKSFVSRIHDIEILIDWYSWEIDKMQKDSSANKSNYFASLFFWVPIDAVSAFEKIVKNSDPNAFIRELPIGDKEMPPVLIKNTEAFKSFELVTKVYGLPKTTEPDPTPYLAPFFALFFAMAFSDFGYGLVLFLISAMAAYKFPEGTSEKLFFKLFAIVGFLTMGAGLLMGTVFGTELAAGMRILNPSEDPIGTLFVLFGLGIFQLMAGLAVGFYWSVKQGDWKTALGEKTGYIIFLIGVLATFFTGENIYAFSTFGFMLFLNFIFSPSPGIVKRTLKALGCFWGLVGYLGDILSYSRILALGLATGIIAMVVNMVAGMAVDMMPVVGWFVAIIVLLLGHSMNFFLSALGAFVHSARLQFVEFFSKFMEGGGRSLKPFAKQGRYIEFKNN